MTILLYASSVLIWGSTWLAIKFQLTQVPPILSVAYRFALAAAILFGYCVLTKRRLRFPGRDHLLMTLQGGSLFGAGYVLCYLASQYLTSGLVAVLFSIIVVFNIFNLRLFMGLAIRGRAVIGGGFGLIGISLVFWPELVAFRLSEGLVGCLLTLAAAYAASIGNVIGQRNASTGLPVAQANAYAMAYGAVMTFLVWLAFGGEPVMSWSADYLLPVLYLSVFGSVIAFGCYMALIGRIGADIAAYTAVLSPVIAIVLSTLFEDYVWAPLPSLGLVLVLVGNVVVLTGPETLKRFPLAARARPAP